MKSRLHARRRPVQTGPDLFAAADRQRVRTLPLSARRLVRRHGMSAATALIVAEAAGFRLGEMSR